VIFLAFLYIFGYIEMLKESSQIQLTPLIGYQLNMEQLFIKMVLKLKNSELKKKRN